MDIKDLVDQYVAADAAYRAAREHRESLRRLIEPHLQVGQELAGTDRKIRRRDRRVLVPAKLKAKVSNSMWTSITERKPVAVLYNAAIKRGKLDAALLDECSTRSETWLEVI